MRRASAGTTTTATTTTAMASSTTFAVALLLLAGAVGFAAADDWSGWSQGRATHYGNNDGMSIHSGSCMFGHLDKNKGTGRDIAAISDKASDYAGSCGRCYEVACRPGSIKDGYGQHIDRNNGACYGGKTVIVTVTDTCPCYYPSNQYSNQRWCCNDQFHMDLSHTAFEKIASTGLGVIPIYYRQVACPGGWSHGTANRGGDGAWPNRGL